MKSNNQEKIENGPYIVNSENELNDAIIAINGSTNKFSIIDVQTNFRLTKDTTAVTNNMTIMSSTKKAINDGGYCFLTIINGAVVSLAMDASGTGTINLNGDGNNNGNTLIGLTGGAVTNISIANDGNLIVNAGEEFKTGEIYFNPISGAYINGVLKNSTAIQMNGSTISNEAFSHPEVGDIYFPEESESSLKIAANSIFKVGNVTVKSIGWIMSDGSGSIMPSGTLRICGSISKMHTDGCVSGVNIIGTIILDDGGHYTATTDSKGTPGGNATCVTNNSGVFDLGNSGIWNIDTYNQTIGTHTTPGILRFTLPDFKGNNTSFLAVKDANIIGGIIEINAAIFYLPPGTVSSRTKIISASGTLTISDLNAISRFNYFPEGITPSLEQVGNDVYLILTVS